jgi:hypothetical protein
MTELFSVEIAYVLGDAAQRELIIEVPGLSVREALDSCRDDLVAKTMEFYKRVGFVPYSANLRTDNEGMQLNLDLVEGEGVKVRCAYYERGGGELRRDH